MSYELAGTIAILALAVILFLSERLRPDLIAMLTLVLLTAAGIITAAESFSGFSNSAVIIIISVFILAEGLAASGISEAVAGYLLRWGGKREATLVGLFMAAGSFLSLFLNNIAAAAVLIPSAGSAAEKSDVPISKLLIPMVYATILGGMATLLTTMNIVVGAVFETSGLPGFGLLDFLPVGLPVCLAGIAYMVFWGRFRLPGRNDQRAERAGQGSGKLFSLYGMNEFFFKAKIPAGSYLIGKKVSQSTLREEFRLSLLAVNRDGRKIPGLGPDTILRRGDILTLKGKADEFAEMDREPRLELLDQSSLSPADVETSEGILAEIMLSPRSKLIGSTLKEVMFLQKYGMNVIAIWRGDQAIRREVRNTRLAYGDALLGIIPEEKLRLMAEDPDLIPLTSLPGKKPASGKAPVALAVLAATLLTVVFTPLPMAQVFFAGAVLMLLTRILTMEQAYRAIDWRAVFLVAGMLPLALAMQNSGLAGQVSALLLSTLGSAPPLVLVALLFLLSALLTQAISGAAVAVFMAPIAAMIAQASGAPAQAFGMAVALGASMAFLTPLGHPVNILVMGAGGYRFGDYRRVGWPLFIIISLVVLGVFSLRWKLI